MLALKNEMEIRKAISNNSILVTLTRQESREADHGLRQSVQQNDDAMQNLNQKVEE
ncbi:integrating conjugative element protein, PFL_4711 family [Klebsiella variicola]|nr:integrating conjugative element protein, PFL_4711 family [Klebsiella variicola]